MKAFLVKLLLLSAVIAAVQYFVGFGALFEYLKNLVRSNSSPEVFVLVMGIGCAAGLPLSFCYLFAGAVYPFWTAWPLCLCGLFTSASLGYLAGVFLAPKNLAERMFSKFGFSLRERGMMNLNFIVRVAPVMPYSAQNILLGAAGSGYGVYMLVNMLVQAAISVVMLLLSGAIFAQGGIDLKRGAIIAALIIVIAIEHWILRKIYPRSNKNAK